ncbi:MAG: ABC transporter ATP-binding protein [Chloroflexi bacterium]|nr:ABC transporter ATP-binding protein [Chloroflexota bacterium]
MIGEYEYEDDDIIGNAYDARIVRRLAGYLRPFRPLLVGAVLVLLAMIGLDTLGPMLVRYAIDSQLAQGRTDELPLIVGIYVGIGILLFVLRYCQTLLMTYIGQRVMMALGVELFTHFQRMAIAFFDRNPVGRLVTRVTNDVATLEMVVSQGVVEIAANLLLVMAIAVMLLVLDWRLALAMYVLLPVLIYVVRKLAARQRDGFRDQRVWLARINAYLNENISGMAVVQLFNRQPENLRRFDDRNSGLLRANLRVVAVYSIFEPTVVLFNAVTVGTILWYGGGRVAEDTLTLGTLVAFLQYMQRFYWPIRELSDRFNTLQQAMASSERIFRLLDEPEEIVDPVAPRQLTKVNGKIEFRNVWFAYERENWVLEDVSFVIKPGEKVAVVGATGAGKSTLMNLLLRFYDVQRGTILIDDIPIADLSQRDLRRHVRMVLQDPFLLTDTVLENIRMRDQAISRQEVEQAAALVGATEFVSRLPQGWDTVLAERGANLSVGQKQLIALARVAAFDPEIVLVMDEATASVDPVTDQYIQRSIRKIMLDRSAIIIAHRLNTIQDVDWIIVLHHGRLVETGTHRELLERRDVYHRLYELQYKTAEAGTRGPT